jgi:hypothetical protein
LNGLRFVVASAAPLTEHATATTMPSIRVVMIHSLARRRHGRLLMALLGPQGRLTSLRLLSAAKGSSRSVEMPTIATAESPTRTAQRAVPTRVKAPLARRVPASRALPCVKPASASLRAATPENVRAKIDLGLGRPQELGVRTSRCALLLPPHRFDQHKGDAAREFLVALSAPSRGPQLDPVFSTSRLSGHRCGRRLHTEWKRSASAPAITGAGPRDVSDMQRRSDGARSALTAHVRSA